MVDETFWGLEWQCLELPKAFHNPSETPSDVQECRLHHFHALVFVDFVTTWWGIGPHIKEGKSVLVVGHKNSLKAWWLWNMCTLSQSQLEGLGATVLKFSVCNLDTPCHWWAPSLAPRAGTVHVPWRYVRARYVWRKASIGNSAFSHGIWKVQIQRSPVDSQEVFCETYDWGRAGIEPLQRWLIPQIAWEPLDFIGSLVFTISWSRSKKKLGNSNASRLPGPHFYTLISRLYLFKLTQSVAL